MRVRMRACMHVCKYVGMCAMCAWVVRFHGYVSMHVCLFVCTVGCCAQVCMCVGISMHVCTPVCMHDCAYVQLSRNLLGGFERSSRGEVTWPTGQRQKQ